MRTNEVDILMVPGWTGSGPDHWQSRWEARLKTARRILVPDVNKPVRGDWVKAIHAAVEVATRPVVIVAHSCGVPAVAHAAQTMPHRRVVGAFLVAPPDVTNLAPLEAMMAEAQRAGETGLALLVGFAPLPTEPFPFPSLVVASRNDKFCSFEAAGDMALDWGSELVDAGEVEHLNTASGHGPWPEGALRFGAFLRQLTADTERPTFG